MRRKSSTSWCFGVLAVALSGCGGETSGGTPSGNERPDAELGEAREQVDRQPVPDGSDEGTPRGSFGDMAGSRPLGECEPGFVPDNSERPCTWLADGLCHAEKDNACNCICPQEKDSVCVSGFPAGEDGRTPVICE